MQTDWVLIGRLAGELEARLRGSRVQDAGLLDDGRIGLVLRHRGKPLVLAIDLFGSPPLVTIEEAELAIVEEPGFIRALARTLKSMVLEAVNARRFDRLLRLRFGSRSRFGVGEQVDCYLELVPRFGNMLLVKGESIVAARKEFTPADNARRVIVAGGPYVLPPLPANPRTVDEVAADRPVLELFAELRTRQTARAENEGIERRRHALQKRLAERETKLRRELDQLAAKRGRAAAREDLRGQGEAIFATLHELDEEQREAEKERARVLFAEYKRLGKSLPHVDARERSVNDALNVVETLRWEAERAGGEELGDVESAVNETERRKRAQSTARPSVTKRKRRALECARPPDRASSSAARRGKRRLTFASLVPTISGFTRRAFPART